MKKSIAILVTCSIFLGITPKAEAEEAIRAREGKKAV
jgi:hypothetical protein